MGQKLAKQTRRHFLKKTGIVIALPILTSLSGCNNTLSLENKVNQGINIVESNDKKSVKNIYYIRDNHTLKHISDKKRLIESDPNLSFYDGVLLEGLEFQKYSIEDIDSIYKQLKEIYVFLRKNQDEINSEKQKLAQNQSIIDILSAIHLRQLLPKELNSNSIEEDIRIFQVQDSDVYESKKMYFENFIDNLIRNQTDIRIIKNPIKINGKNIGLAFSPGIGYLGLKQLHLYGIEDFKVYLDSYKKIAGIKDFSEVLSQLELQKYPVLIRASEFLRQNRNTDCTNGDYLSELKNLERERAVMRNISNLPSGDYILIMGVGHEDNLTKVAERYPDINFKYYEAR